jgi:hypothetical protein
MAAGLLEREVEEERKIIGISGYLEALERAINHSDRGEVTRLVKLLSRYERQLSKRHIAVLKTIGHLREGPARSYLNVLESHIRIFYADTILNLARGGALSRALSQSNFRWTYVEKIVQKTKKDFQAWEALEQSLIKHTRDLGYHLSSKR